VIMLMDNSNMSRPVISLCFLSARFKLPMTTNHCCQ
jgi:hypothetical protein